MPISWRLAFDKRTNFREVDVAGIMRGVQLARLLGEWQVRTHRRGPEYAALAEAVRGLLTDGRLALGVRLPAERELADALGISRTTVTAAYRTLRESGHLTSRRGAGSWTELPGGHRIGSGGVIMTIDDGDDDVIDLNCAALAAPPQITDAVQKAALDLPPYLSRRGYQPTGIVPLRELVAARYTERGLPTDPEQIMITAGVQQGLDLLVRLFAAPGQRVLVEAPTYPNALTSLASHRHRILTYNLDANGWDPELMLSTLRGASARLAYLIPDFHNPTGHLMPEPLRARLPAVAHAAGTELVIDESFADLRLDAGANPPPVAVYDRGARTISIGGMSKPFWGGLRIGWIRAAAPTIARLAALRVNVDMASPVLEQLIAVHLLHAADEIIAVRRRDLRAQRDALVAALRAEVPQWRFTVPSGGLCLWIELDAPVATALARAAADLGLRIAPGPRFGVDGTFERFMRVPYVLPVPQVREAVARLSEARHRVERPARRWSEPAVVA
jgi:DNA-binding transcriptional MocR family regulator